MLKRTSFKKLTFEQAKLKLKTRSVKPKKARTRIKKQKVKSISFLKKKLWKIVSQKIRERDKFICQTSGLQVSGSNAHCGHMYPSSVGGILLRYHPHNLGCQSYVENIHHSGNGAVYFQKYTEKYGVQAMNKLKELKNASAQADRHFFETMIDMYEEFELYESEIIKFLESYT